MLSIEPFLFVVYRVPKYQFPVHSPTRHELQLWHGYHGGNHQVYFLLVCLFLIRVCLMFIKGFFQVSF